MANLNPTNPYPGIHELPGPRLVRSAELEIFITDLVQIKLSLIFSELEFAYAQYIIELIFIDPFFIRKSRIQDTFEGTN